MSAKNLVWGGVILGSTIGGVLPYLWSGDLFSSTIWSTVGGLAGVWAGFKLAKASDIL